MIIEKVEKIAYIYASNLNLMQSTYLVFSMASLGFSYLDEKNSIFSNVRLIQNTLFDIAAVAAVAAV